MLKRFITILLTLIMVTTLLAGCGNHNDSGKTDSTKVGGTAEEATGSDKSTEGSKVLTPNGEYTEEKPYHLTFAFIEFYEQDEAARRAVQDAMNKKLIPELHIEVELLPLQLAEYQTTIQLMLSGNDDLDVMPIYSQYAGSWINMNGIHDMNEYMGTAEGQKIVSALGKELASAGTMNGILYGFPANKEYVELGGLSMRADICDKLGITKEYGLEKNKDEYDGTLYDWTVAADIFAKVKAAYPDMVPLYMNSTSQMNRFIHIDSLSDNFGILDWEADHSSTTVVNKFETDTYKKTVSMLADWYDKGYIFKDAQTDTSGAATMMRAGNTFSYITGIKPGFLIEAKAANNCESYAMYFGTGVKSNEGVRSTLFTSNANLYDTGIASTSKDPAMAFKFISALYTDPELMNLWQYGIKDVNYKVQDDGTAYFVDGEDSSNYKYHQNTGWSMGNQFISYVWSDGTKSPNYWEKLKTHNAWGDFTPAFGFAWNSKEYSTELTALSNVLNTYRAALETGSVGSGNVDSTLRKLNDALYAADLKDVIEAKQAQLNEWLAKEKK